MPDPITPTPAPDPSSDATQDSGTEKDERKAQSSGAPPPDWETRYKESSTEAKRLAEERKQMETTLQQKDQQLQQAAYYLQQMQQQQKQQAAPAPAKTEAPGVLLSGEEARALSDATISGDIAEIQRLENLKFERVRANLLADQRQENSRRQEETAAMTSLQQAGVMDMQTNPALASKTMEVYQRLSSDPVRSLTYKEAKLNVGGYDFNPNIMREALLEAKLELGITRVKAQEVARLASDSFIEPGARSAQPIPGQSTEPPKKFDPERHLFDYERTMCGPGKLYKNYDHYWKNMHPDLQSERLRKGEPLRWAQTGRGEVRFSFTKP